MSANPIIERKTPLSEKVLLDVPILCQYPELPTGCEATAAAMLLQFYGVDITPERFASEWLEYDETFYYCDESLVRPDPDQVFVGNPFQKSSYGCYAPVIVKAINRHLNTHTATIITEHNLEALCFQYIAEGSPLLIWATMNMKPSKNGNTWFFADGTPFTWIAGEHCLVLTGYDSTHYYLNDPQTGTVVKYEKELVEQRYQELGSQAIILEQSK